MIVANAKKILVLFARHLMCILFPNSLVISSNSFHTQLPKELTFIVQENASLGSIVADLRHYFINNSSHGNDMMAAAHFSLSRNVYFDLNEQGILSVKTTLDREDDEQLCLSPGFPLQCIWNGLLITGNYETLSIRIHVNDVNNHSPRWKEETSFLLVKITENCEVGTLKELPLADDRDVGANGIVKYSLKEETDFFELETTLGSSGLPMPRLRVTKGLDREEIAWHNFTLLALDGSPPFHTGSLALLIRVVDLNDNAPQFIQNNYNISIAEDLPIGRVLDLSLKARDPDDGMNGDVTYRFSLSTTKRTLEHFSLDSSTGELSIRQSISFDVAQPHFAFVVIAIDHGEPSQSNECSIFVNIIDTNNNSPEIQVNPLPSVSSSLAGASHEIMVMENLPAGQLVATISVRDRDTAKGDGDFTCNLTSEDSFRLSFSKQLGNLKVFKLLTARSFDREIQRMEVAALSCVDEGQSPRASHEMIQVRIADENDNPPVFERRYYGLQMIEGNDAGVLVNHVFAKDADEGVNANVSYAVVWPDSTTENPFQVNKYGQLRAMKSLDRETHPQGYRFKIMAYDQGAPPMNSTVDVEVLLLDINDCTPQFSKKFYEFSVNENVGSKFQPLTVDRILASDCDLGANKDIEYRLLSEHKPNPFQVGQDGYIHTREILDREYMDQYKLVALALDKPQNSNEQRTGTATIHIKVKDLNDNSPQFTVHNFTQTRIQVSYKEVPDYVIAQVSARDLDADKNGQVLYSITKGNLYGLFHIREHNGEIYVGDYMNVAHQGNIDLEVTAMDQGLPQHSNVTVIRIIVNDSPPKGQLGQAHHLKDGFDINGIENNQIIIISIVAATTVVCIILLVAICMMAKQAACGSRRRQAQRDITSTPTKAQPLTNYSLSYSMNTDPNSFNTMWYNDLASGKADNYHLLTDYSGISIAQQSAYGSIPQEKPSTYMLPTSIHPSTITLEETAMQIDSDADSGRGGSVNNNCHNSSLSKSLAPTMFPPSSTLSCMLKPQTVPHINVTTSLQNRYSNNVLPSLDDTGYYLCSSADLQPIPVQISNHQVSNLVHMASAGGGTVFVPSQNAPERLWNGPNPNTQSMNSELKSTSLV